FHFLSDTAFPFTVTILNCAGLNFARKLTSQTDWPFADHWDAYSVNFNTKTVGIIDRAEAIIVKPLPFEG
ncbi:hypothetical protein, partial [Pseudoalteromonas sp. S1650]|uniref:hypothetical protein n=1 Tax=Pseudoalteromonas sp. S1650 TaxID=579509 RepID=UPI001BB1BF3D